MSEVENTFFSDVANKLKTQGDPELRAKILADPYYFFREVLGNQDMFPADRNGEQAGQWGRMFDFVFGLGKDYSLGVLNSPRNTFKTTVITAFIVWCIIRDRNVRILYFTNTYQNSMKVSRSLRSILLTNTTLIKAFGPFGQGMVTDESETWRQDYFYVLGRTTNVTEPTFTAASVGTTKVGNHYDIIIGDDCVDFDNTRTADSIQNTIDWYKYVGSLRDKQSKYGPGGALFDQGTRYTMGDLHGWLLGESDDKESPWRRYKSLVLRAIDNPVWDEDRRTFVNPKLNFPFVLTKEKLEDERDRGSYYFATQFQNEPASPEDAIFKPHWFRMVPNYDVPGDLRVYILTDFAFEVDESNDRTAIWVVGLDWERTAWVLDFDVGRWMLHERCRRVIDLADKYHAEKIAIEKVVSNEGIKAEIERQRQLRRLKFSIQEIGGRSVESKQLRIISLQPRFEGKRIYFVQRDPGDMIGVKVDFLRINSNGRPEGEIAREFLNFPKAVHDDIPDALSDIDKMDEATKSYYFTGSYNKGGTWNYGMGPSMVNGHIQPLRGEVNAPQTRTEECQDIWKRRAAAIRQLRGGSGLWGR